jgi:hypothetical protein
MLANQSRLAVKLLPSMMDFAFLMPVVFLFGRMEGLKNLLGDCDTGWHIRTGEWIFANHGVPAHDIFSYSKPDGVWYAWEWLSDVTFAWLNAHGGLAMVALFAVALLSTTFALVFQLARRRSNAIVAIVVTMMAAAASSIHWLARPHLFTLLFIVLFYAALENVRAGKTSLGKIPYLAILPAATALWTNLHGGFFVGIILIGAYACGELLTVAFTPRPGDRGPALIMARKYLMCTLACLAASLINPYTYHLHAHVAAYLSDPYQSQHIMEFLSVSFHHPIAIFFEAMLLLAAAAAFWNSSRGRYTEAVVLLVWAHAALLAARNIPIFMILAAPPVAALLQDWLALAPELDIAEWARAAVRKFNAVAADMSETDSLGRWHLVSAAGMALLAALLFAPHPPAKFRAEFDPKSFPAGAVETLRGDASARIFTYDQWGDYLIYKLYPRTKVFVDGRSDFYGSAFEEKIINVLNVQHGWEKTLGRFAVDTILLPPSSPLTGALKESSRWRLVYDDGVALVFRAAPAAGGAPVSAASQGSGISRDREVTKTQASGPSITVTKKTT